ncbi:MAG: hypothetical protein IKR19_08430 [Acholeplasmatales bacterium]|nr:hypothetical protein [Acholeplasmatales bacterium]
MDQTFLYEVRPRKIITGIHGVAYIRAPRSIYLTKDEVLICLQAGSVYRRFANLDKLERVTITNVDRLHNETFISEEEWEAKSGSNAVVEEKKPVEAEPEKVEEAVTEEATEEKVEEPEEATAVEEEKIEETVEPEEEETVADDSEEPEEEEKVVEAPQQNNIQFKNHHKKNKK